MTGFIKKLFRSKSPIEEGAIEPTPKSTPRSIPAKPPAPRNNEAYFLNSDDAQTFGNLDYMRLSKSVRRTFSKKKLGKDNESIRLISSIQSPVVNLATTTDAANQANGSVSKASARRTADSSMDMFRKMAREIKKG